MSQLVEAFANDWEFANGEMLEGDAWSPSIPSGSGPLARVIDSGPDGDLEKVEFAVLQAVSCARSSIAVMTPYFLPDERLITALALAAMRGVAVDLVIPRQSNHPLVDWATRTNISPLLPDGVRIWQSPPPFHHGKLMVVDGEWCLIGSCNWDIRSFRLNFELCVEGLRPQSGEPAGRDHAARTGGRADPGGARFARVAGAYPRRRGAVDAAVPVIDRAEPAMRTFWLREPMRCPHFATHNDQTD